MNIVKYLIAQSKNPEGDVGTFMLKMMDIAHENIINEAISPLVINGNNSILDIGCGSGLAIKLMVNKFNNSSITGMDISETCIRQSIKKNKEGIRKGKVKLILGDVEKIPFTNNSFDIVTAFQTHYYWFDFPKALLEIKRVLISGGIFVLSGEMSKMEYHMKEYKSSLEYEDLLKHIGFEHIQLHYKKGFMILYAQTTL